MTRIHAGLSYRAVVLFANTFPVRPQPHWTTVKATYERFMRTGSVYYPRRGIATPRAQPPTQLVVLVVAQAYLYMSTRQHEQLTEVRKTK